MRRLFQRFTKFRQEHLLFQYFTLVFTHWQAVLWGGSVLAVAFGWHFVTADWPYPVKVTACIVALFFAGYYVWRADHVRLVPKIEVEGARIVYEPADNARNNVAIFPLAYPYNVHVKIALRCLTEAPVYECKAHLLKALRWSFKMNVWEEMPFGPQIIGWHPDLGTTQHPGAEQPLEFVIIEHPTGNIILICRDQHVDFGTSKSGPKKLRFKMKITYSDRVNGQFVTIKPVDFGLDVSFDNNQIETALVPTLEQTI